MLVVAVLATAGWVVPAGARTVAKARTDTCAAVPPGTLHAPSQLRGRTPVLLVHGFSGGPGDFSRAARNGQSMVHALGSLDRVAIATFDYSSSALEWVTDPRIGPALADSIACLSHQSGHDVIVVADSMGGLAVRYAQGQTVDGTRISRLLERVVTVGTPSEGSQLLSIAGTAAAPAFDALLDGARELCGNPETKRPTRKLCDLLGAEGTPAVQGLVPGSAELAALPVWAPGLVVHSDAANLTLYVSALGMEQSFAVGDIVVSVDSATADASVGESPFVVNCRSTLDGAVSAVDHSPCAHGNELSNRRIVRDVREQVERGLLDALRAT